MTRCCKAELRDNASYQWSIFQRRIWRRAPLRPRGDAENAGLQNAGTVCVSIDRHNKIAFIKDLRATQTQRSICTIFYMYFTYDYYLCTSRVHEVFIRLAFNRRWSYVFQPCEFGPAFLKPAFSVASSDRRPHLAPVHPQQPLAACATEQ